MRIRGSRRRLLTAAATAALLAGFLGPNPIGAQPVLRCEIVSAHAAVWAQANAGGNVVYYGHAIMHTRNCGISPAQIAATFTPMAGTASTCDARGTLRNDDAVCTSAISGAVQGTHVVTTASGNTEGEGGADAFSGTCTVILPTRGPASCEFPSESL